MRFKETLQIEDDTVEAVRQGMMKLRGEIHRLYCEKEELVRDYAKLNAEHDKLLDQREMLIQSACNAYHEMCPDLEELDSFDWLELWHSITQPIELDVRAEMIKRGCKLEE